MADPASPTFEGAREPKTRCTWLGVMGIRLVVGVVLALVLTPLCVDDYFRVYHAIFFWQRPSFSASTNWLPMNTWIVGTLVGLTRDSLLAPRFFSLAIGLGGAWLSTRDAETSEERHVRLLLSACAPTSVLLFSLPLTEALFGAFVTVHVSALTRYVDHGRAGDALLASVAMLSASATRYESWIMLPFSVALVLVRTPTDTRRWVVALLALLAGTFPLRWMSHLVDHGFSPLSFLGVIERDHLGASMLAETVSGGSAPFAGMCGLCLVFLVSGMRRRHTRRVRITSAYGLLYAGFVVLAAASGSLPSQLPLRLFHVPVLLAVPALVAELGLAASYARAASAGLVGIVLGLSSLFGLSPVVPASEVRLADRLRAALARDDASTALVDGPFPDSAYFVVAANTAGRVYMDGVGRTCRASPLDCDFACGRPAWVDRVRHVVVAADQRDALIAQGFVVEAHGGRYWLLTRPSGIRPLCSEGATRGASSR